MAKSIAWTLVKRGENGEAHCCTLCEWSCKGTTATSNIILHLKQRHSDEFRAVVEMKEEVKEEESKPEIPVKRQKVGSGEENTKEMKARTFLAKALCSTSTGPEIANNVWFREFVHTIAPVYQLPSSKTVYGDILKLSEQINEENAWVLGNRKFVVSMDRSNENQESLTHCFYVYYFEENVRKRRLMSVKDPEPRQTAESLEEVLQRMTGDFGDLTNAVGYVTDGDLSKVRGSKIPSIQCAAQSIHLVMTVVICHPSIAKLLAKGIGVAKTLHRNPMTNMFFEQVCSVNGTQSSTTRPFPSNRWLAASQLLNDLKEYNSVLEVVPDLHAFALQPDELPTITFFMKIGNMLKVVLSELESENSTISTVIPHFAKLVKNIEALPEFQDDENSQHGISVVFHEQMKQRLLEFSTSDHHAVAVLLDPRIAFQPVLPDTLLWNEFRQRCVEFGAKFPFESRGKAKLREKTPETDTFWTDFGEDVGDSSELRLEIQQEIEEYGRIVGIARPGKNVNLAAWWSSQSTLKLLPFLAHQLLLFPAGTANCERLFSKAGVITSNTKRNRVPVSSVSTCLALSASDLETSTTRAMKRDPIWKAEIDEDDTIRLFDEYYDVILESVKTEEPSVGDDK